MKQQLLTLDGLQHLFNNYSMMDISRETGIPYDTLKNYSSGRTPLDTLSYRNCVILTEWFDKQYKCVPKNIIVNPKTFDELTNAYRVDYNPYRELAQLLSAYDTRNERYKEKHELVTFFIDCNHIGDELSTIELCSAIGLGLGIQIIFKQSSVLSEIIEANATKLLTSDSGDVTQVISVFNEPKIELSKYRLATCVIHYVKNSGNSDLISATVTHIIELSIKDSWFDDILDHLITPEVLLEDHPLNMIFGNNIEGLRAMVDACYSAIDTIKGK